MEKYYLHFADAVHVVKAEDGECLKRINPHIKPVVIPLASIGTIPVLRSPSCSTQRQPKVLIWGNLSLGNISSGYTALMPALEQAQIGQMTRISVLGRIPYKEFLRKSGAMGRYLDYIERTDDLDAFLGQFDLVIIPDLGGSGQKFRCLDALRLGKCVVGFDIAFAGLPKHSRPYFARCQDPQDLAYQIKKLLAPGEWQEMGREGQRVFIQHFGFESFQRKWCSLIGSIPPLQGRG